MADMTLDSFDGANPKLEADGSWIVVAGTGTPIASCNDSRMHDDDLGEEIELDARRNARVLVHAYHFWLKHGAPSDV